MQAVWGSRGAKVTENDGVKTTPCASRAQLVCVCAHTHTWGDDDVAPHRARGRAAMRVAESSFIWFRRANRTIRADYVSQSTATSFATVSPIPRARVRPVASGIFSHRCFSNRIFRDSLCPFHSHLPPPSLSLSLPLLSLVRSLSRAPRDTLKQIGKV